jgi:HSP20 family protein
MPHKKPSFIERLTGAVPVEDQYDDTYEQENDAYDERYARRPLHDSRGIKKSLHTIQNIQKEPEWNEEEEEDDADGQLAVDVYQTPEEIVVRSVVAGIDPNDLHISISRDMVIIKGAREDTSECAEDDFFHKELYWGSFSRTVLLPAEIEVDEGVAKANNGLLTIRLPKIDKEKKKDIKVQVGK